MCVCVCVRVRVWMAWDKVCGRKIIATCKKLINDRILMMALMDRLREVNGPANSLTYLLV